MSTPATPQESIDQALGAFSARVDLSEAYGQNALAIYALQLRFGIEDASELADSVVDGPGDRKADVVHIHEETGTAVILQAYLADDPDKSNPPLNKASDLNVAASWLLNPADRAKLTPAVQTVAALLEAAIRDGDISAIEIWYSHNLPENPDVTAELEQAAMTARAAVETAFGAQEAAVIEFRGVQIGRESLGRLFASRVTRILIHDEIEIPVSGWNVEESAGWKAAYASVSGTWLKELLQAYGPDQLFAGNIRDYLGRRKSSRNINYTIEQTAEKQPENFWVFNNGITGLTNELIIDDGHLKVRGLTIVNGAQTTGALASAKSAEGVSVLARFVQADDPELVDDIIRANNTQNEIKASDFRSNDPH